MECLQQDDHGQPPNHVAWEWGRWLLRMLLSKKEGEMDARQVKQQMNPTKAKERGGVAATSDASGRRVGTEPRG